MDLRRFWFKRKESGIECPVMYGAEHKPVAGVVTPVFLFGAQMRSV
jgi:hypothetical protein